MEFRLTVFAFVQLANQFMLRRFLRARLAAKGYFGLGTSTTFDSTLGKQGQTVSDFSRTYQRWYCWHEYLEKTRLIL